MRKKPEDRSLPVRIERHVCEVPMSDIQQIDSPDQRYYVLLTGNEMRM
jgi:hypothetical protein